MIRYIKTFEVIFSRNNISGMHISDMWHSLNVYKYFCPLSVHIVELGLYVLGLIKTYFGLVRTIFLTKFVYLYTLG